MFGARAIKRRRDKEAELKVLSSNTNSLTSNTHSKIEQNQIQTRQSKQCGFSIYIFDNLKSKSMVRSEKMALSGLVFARKIARMILIQNI